MSDFEELRNFFGNDKYATEQTGIVIDSIGDGTAQCSMDITPMHLNALGGVQGGAIFTLADFTFAVASNTINNATVSLAVQITYHKPAKGKKLISNAEKISFGRHVCYYSVTVKDDVGTLVATATVNGFCKQ